MAARRVNLRYLTLALLLLVGLVCGVYVLNKFQVRRKAATLLATVDGFIAEGKPAEAIAPLQKYLAIRPADNTRYLQLAGILAERGLLGIQSREEYAYAKDVLRNAVTRNPDQHDLREKMLVLLLGAGESEAAFFHASELRKAIDPREDPEAYGRIGMLYAQAAIKTRRIEELEQILAELTQSIPGVPLPPGRIDAFMFLAALRSEAKGETQVAEDILRRMVEAFPDNARAWKLFAGWLRRNGKLEQAADAISKARGLAPDDEEAILISAMIALTQGKADRAQAFLGSLKADAPASEPLVMARAELARMRGDAAAMIGILESGLVALPSSAPLTSELLVVLSDAGKLDELRTRLAEARKLLPAEAPAMLYAEATLAMGEQRWSQSLKIWERLKDMVATDPSLARRVDVAMATCHESLGDTLRAAEARRRIAAAAPDSELAQFLEAESLEQSGRPEEASVIIERIAKGLSAATLADRPEIWKFLLRLRLAEQTRRPAEERDWTAVDALVEALSVEDGIPPLLAKRLRTDVLEAKGDMEGALRDSQASVADHPDDPALLAQCTSLLARMGRVEEAWALIDAAPPAMRSSAELFNAEIELLVRTNRDAWGGRDRDLQARILALHGGESRGVKRQLLAFQIGQGADAAARQVAAAILADDPDNILVRMMLLDIVSDRDDVAAVAEQVGVIEKQYGTDTAISRVARAVKLIVDVRTARMDTGFNDSGSLTAEQKATLAEARKLLEVAAAERPEWDAPSRQMASIADLEGDRAAAIGHLRKAIRRGETLPLARRRLVLTLVETGRFGEAAPVMASLGDFGGPAIDRIRADFFAARGDTDEALQLGASLTKADPDNADLLTWYANLLSVCGKIADSEAQCRRAIELAPKDATPRRSLLSLLVREKREEEARAVRDAALTALEGRAKDRFGEYAAALLGGGEDLEDTYRKAALADPGNPEAARRLVEHLQARGRLKQAREELQRIAALDSAENTSTIVWARRRLAEQVAASGSYRELVSALAALSLNVDAEGRQSDDDMALEASLLVRRNEPTSWRRALQVLELLAERRPLTVEERLMRERARAVLVPALRAQVIKDIGEIADSPEGSTSMFAVLIELCLEENDVAGAEAWLEKLSSVSPESPGTLRFVAKVARAKGDEETAVKVMKRLLPETRVTDSIAGRMVASAMVVDELGFHEEAGRVFAEVAGLSKDGVLLHARSLGRRHRTKEAIALAESVRADVSPQAFLETLIAISRYDDADPDSDAVADVERIAASMRRENPGAADIALSAAILEDAFGRTSRAMKGYRDLLGMKDLDPRVRALASANLAFDIAHPETAEEATKLIDAAVAELGPTTDLLDSRSLVRLARGQTRQALEDATDAVLLQPSPRNLLHLALIRAEIKDLEGAREAFSRAIEKGLKEERLSPDDRRRLKKVEGAIGAVTPSA
jgi:tetratricopeptide (TPR) repeat protein